MAEIVGVDSSIDMLSRAATAHDAAEPLARERVSLVEGDMRDWPGTGDAFDAVVIACCSVSHLLTLDDRRRTWGTAFRLLRPSVRLIKASVLSIPDDCRRAFGADGKHACRVR
jgi:ubiquinone/menaquinone biosynthesis C-methylase UbiE